VSAEKKSTTSSADAIDSWYGQIGGDRVVVNGRHIA